MRSPLFYLLFILLCAANTSHAQLWLWATKIPGSEGSQPQRVATDASGNVIVTGGAYIAKYDEYSNLLWKRNSTSGFNAEALGVCTDGAGNIYVTGTYTTTTTFGTTTLVNEGNEDIFIAKYDASGNVLWASGAGGIHHDIAYSVAADAYGNVYVGGSFASPTIVFGSVSLGGPGTNLFLTKYNSLGYVVWAKMVSNDGTIGTYTRASAIAVDPTGEILVTGEFSGSSVAFGTHVLTNTRFPSGDAFAAKFDTLGEVLWANQLGSDYYDAAWSIATDGMGNSYVTGNFTGDTMWIGTDTVLYNEMGGEKDGYVASYTAAGDFRWAKQIGGTRTEDVLGAAADALGNLYLAIVFNSPTLSIGSTTLTNASVLGTSDIVMSIYTTSGTEVWAHRIGKSRNDHISGIALDGDGSVYVSGTYGDTISFGTYTLLSPGVGFTEIFLARLGMVSVLAPVVPSPMAVSVYPNPVNGELTIAADEAINTVSIVNTIGQEVYRGAYDTREVRLNISDLPPGGYLLQINNAQVKRLIKQ